MQYFPQHSDLTFLSIQETDNHTWAWNFFRTKFMLRPEIILDKNQSFLHSKMCLGKDYDVGFFKTRIFHRFFFSLLLWACHYCTWLKRVFWMTSKDKMASFQNEKLLLLE